MTDTTVVRLVVRILGILAGIGLLGLIGLTWLLVQLVERLDDSRVALFAAVIGAVGVVGTLTGSVVGIIGGLLISTRSGDTTGVAKEAGKAEVLDQLKEVAAAPVEPLAVVGVGGGPVETVDVAAAVPPPAAE